MSMNVSYVFFFFFKFLIEFLSSPPTEKSVSTHDLKLFSSPLSLSHSLSHSHAFWRGKGGGAELPMNACGDDDDEKNEE